MERAHPPCYTQLSYFKRNHNIWKINFFILYMELDFKEKKFPVTIAQFRNIQKCSIVLLEYAPSCRNNKREKGMPEYKWFYLCFLSLGLHLEGLCFAVFFCCHLSSTKYKENTISNSLETELSIQHIILLVQNQQCLSQMLCKQ